MEVSWVCCQSNIFSGLRRWEHSSKTRARGILVQSLAPREKMGSPESAACPTTWCFWPAQNWPRRAPKGRAVHLPGAAGALARGTRPAPHTGPWRWTCFACGEKIRASRREMQMKGCQYRCQATCTTEHALSPKLLVSYHCRKWNFLL